ncbi:MAG: helix-turn-helix domain-containing protein [Angelakisella sp.]
MAARLVQSILLEIKSKVPFVIGVVDATGVILACTELRLIGESLEASQGFFSSNTDEGVRGGYTFRLLESQDNGVQYGVFADDVGETASTVCSVTVVAINNSKTLYDEKHDKVTFIKKILLDNILPGDIYVKSREMQFQNDVRRVAFLVRTIERQDAAVVEMLQNIFTERQKDFAVTITENEVVLVKELKNSDPKVVQRIAKQIDTALTDDLNFDHVIGVGGVALQLKDIARSFKEAQIAIEIGHVFDEDVSIMNFETLGVGRLIYQLPTTLCEMFLSEVFKKGSIEALDDETLFTIQKFFENNLNVSETARKLFVHRNTLVYRLEKIRKLTGLDLREFDHAIVLKVALMVKKYLKSRDNYN